MNIESFQKCLTSNPSSDALRKLIRAFPHACEFQNDSQRLLFFIYAWTGCVATRGIALTLDDAICERFEELSGALEEVGAEKSLEYARAAQRMCGGIVPSDEIERAELVMKFAEELYELDEVYNKLVREESADALLGRFMQNVEASFNELAQGATR